MTDMPGTIHHVKRHSKSVHRIRAFRSYSQSGFDGRDNGPASQDQYTESKTIWIDLSDPREGKNAG